MEAVWFIAIVVVGLISIGVVLWFADEVEDRQGRDLNAFQRVLVILLDPLAGGLHRMRKSFPKSWSDHPDSKYPRHDDH